ncbi:MAG: Smr/MutS family protein [Acidobacteriota bacterium]|nr:Smr/MutS family protein [Acidobacteriota bacterium]
MNDNKSGEFRESGESGESKEKFDGKFDLTRDSSPDFLDTPDSPDLFNPFPEPVELEITDSIDLHSFAPRDVKAVVEAYLEEAHRKGFRLVRIIHGKGIGVQREIVRKVLQKTDFVKKFKTADEFSGSWGATIVEFHD